MRLMRGIRDGSNDLDSATKENGRFENGWVHIGELTEPSGTMTMNIDGNGKKSFYKTGGFDIFFSATSTTTFLGKEFEISGKIIKLNRLGDVAFIVTSQSEPIADWSVFANGTFSIGGVNGTINWLGPNMGNVSDLNGNIPIVAHDDDVDNALPQLPDISDMQSSDSISKNRFKQVFIRPVYDGGGNLNNNQVNVPFVKNTESSKVYLWQSRKNNKNNFWVIYLLNAFQDSYGHLQNDFDADLEGGTWASANNPPMGAGVLIYSESMRDGSLPSSWMKRVLIHEVGHNFGCSDKYINGLRDGIMHGYSPAGNIASNYFFIGEDINIIRSKKKPN